MTCFPWGYHIQGAVSAFAVYVYVCKRVSACVHKSAVWTCDACPYVCAYVCLCMSVCMSAFNRFPLCAWACVNVCVHTSVSAFSRSPVCAHAHVCLCVCMHERVRAHSRTLALAHLHFSRPAYPAWGGITGHGLGMFSMSLANAPGYPHSHPGTDLHSHHWPPRPPQPSPCLCLFVNDFISSWFLEDGYSGHISLTWHLFIFP